MADTYTVVIEQENPLEHPLFELCRFIRTQVFIEEQKVEAANEFDDLQYSTVHFALTRVSPNSQSSGQTLLPIANLRLRRLKLDETLTHAPANLVNVERDSVVILGRMAVLAEYRKRGFGKRIMEIAEAHILKRAALEGPAYIIVHAQKDKLAFYKSCGYICREPENVFEEEGMAHVFMYKVVPAEGA